MYTNKRTKKRSVESYHFSNMMSQVAFADIVIINATKNAIAIQYDEIKSDAPWVTAKGMDKVAVKMIKIAQKNAIFIKQDPELAKSLYYLVEKINTPIPEDLYAEVAEIMAMVYKIGKKT